MPHEVDSGCSYPRGRTTGTGDMLCHDAPYACEKHGMPLSPKTIVISIITGFFLAWIVGEAIGGWRGELTELGVMIALGAVLCFACRNDQGD